MRTPNRLISGRWSEGPNTVFLGSNFCGLPLSKAVLKNLLSFFGKVGALSLKPTPGLAGKLGGMPVSGIAGSLADHRSGHAIVLSNGGVAGAGLNSPIKSGAPDPDLGELVAVCLCGLLSCRAAFNGEFSDPQASQHLILGSVGRFNDNHLRVVAICIVAAHCRFVHR